MATEDFPVVAKLWYECDLVGSEYDSDTELRAATGIFPRYALVAIKDDRVIGSVTGYLTGWGALLGRLAVSAEERELGVGSRLVEELRSRFVADGIRGIAITVWEANDDVHSFWERRGFEKVDALKVWWHQITEESPAQSAAGVHYTGER